VSAPGASFVHTQQNPEMGKLRTVSFEAKAPDPQPVWTWQSGPAMRPSGGGVAFRNEARLDNATNRRGVSGLSRELLGLGGVSEKRSKTLLEGRAEGRQAPKKLRASPTRSRHDPGNDSANSVDAQSKKSAAIFLVGGFSESLRNGAHFVCKRRFCPLAIDGRPLACGRNGRRAFSGTGRPGR